MLTRGSLYPYTFTCSACGAPKTLQVADLPTSFFVECDHCLGEYELFLYDHDGTLVVNQRALNPEFVDAVRRSREPPERSEPPGRWWATPTWLRKVLELFRPK